MKFLKEICGNCGYPYGSHKVGNSIKDANLCPATEEGIDFHLGPGTKFKPTGKYKSRSKV